MDESLYEELLEVLIALANECPSTYEGQIGRLTTMFDVVMAMHNLVQVARAELLQELDLMMTAPAHGGIISRN